MNIKNTKLIEVLLWSGMQANFLVDSFWIIWKLIKKHGKMLYTTKYMFEISKADEGIWSLISILGNAGKMNYKDTKTLIKLIKSTIDTYNQEFTINSSTENQEIITYLNKKFEDSKIQTETTDNVWLKISWEGRYYKKDLDSDLDKILK